MSDQLLTAIVGQLADIATRLSAPRVAVFDEQGNPVVSIAGAAAAASAEVKAAINAGRSQHIGVIQDFLKRCKPRARVMNT